MKLLVKGFKLSDAAEKLGKARSTLDYQVKLLQALLLEFLANLASFQATEFWCAKHQCLLPSEFNAPEGVIFHAKNILYIIIIYLSMVNFYFN